MKKPKLTKKFFITLGALFVLGGAAAFGGIFYTQKKTINELTDKLNKSDLNKENKIVKELKLEINTEAEAVLKIKQFFLEGIKNNFGDIVELLKKIRVNVTDFFKSDDVDGKSSIIDNMILKIKNYTNQINSNEEDKEKQDKNSLHEFEKLNKETIQLFSDLIDNLIKNKIENKPNSTTENIINKILSTEFKKFNIDLEIAQKNKIYFETKIKELKTIFNLNDQQFNVIISKINSNINPTKTYHELIIDVINLLNEENLKISKNTVSYFENINNINFSNPKLTKAFFENYPVNFTLDNKRIFVKDFKNELNKKTVTIELLKPTSINKIDIDFSTLNIKEFKIQTSLNNIDYKQVHLSNAIDNKTKSINFEKGLNDVMFLKIEFNSDDKNINILNVNSLEIFSKNFNKELENSKKNLFKEFWDKSNLLINNYILKIENINNLSEEELNKRIENLIISIIQTSKNTYEIKELKSQIFNNSLNQKINILKTEIEKLEAKISKKDTALTRNESQIKLLLNKFSIAQSEIEKKDKELNRLINLLNDSTENLTKKVKEYSEINAQFLEAKKLLNESQSNVDNLNSNLSSKNKEISELNKKIKTSTVENIKLKEKHFLNENFVPFNDSDQKWVIKPDLIKVNPLKKEFEILNFENVAATKISFHFYDSLNKKLKKITFDKNQKDAQEVILESNFKEKTFHFYGENDNSYEDYFENVIDIKPYREDLTVLSINRKIVFKNNKLYLSIDYKTKSEYDDVDFDLSNYPKNENLSFELKFLGYETE